MAEKTFPPRLGGESETFVVDTSGRLFAWGSNNRGQLGLGRIFFQRGGGGGGGHIFWDGKFWP